ncbi:MAG TPA: hypothetical protein VIW28_07200 [Gemmatimonadales bacterium]
MRATKARFAILLGLPVLGCGKSEAKKREEVRSCSAITMDAPGAAECLVLQYRWRKAPAESAAAAYERQRDSVAQFKADSAWRANAAAHARELERCAADPSGEVMRCLVSFGWADGRARASADSLWRHDAPQHREQVLTCARQRKMQAGACLQLYHKWSPERALAVDDSIRRAKLR